MKTHIQNLFTRLGRASCAAWVTLLLFLGATNLRAQVTFTLASSPGVGSGPVSVTAADVNGDGKMNLISANFNDNTLSALINNTVFPPPIITVPATILVEATSASGAVVNFSTSATNVAGGAVTTTNTPASGSTFPLGTNTVTVTATSAGSSTNQTFTVTVRDTTAPTLTLLGDNPLTSFINIPFTADSQG
jgi:hypothetical protein